MTTPTEQKIDVNEARQGRRAGMTPILIGGALIAFIGMALVFGLQAI